MDFIPVKSAGFIFGYLVVYPFNPHYCFNFILVARGLNSGADRLRVSKRRRYVVGDFRDMIDFCFGHLRSFLEMKKYAYKKLIICV